MEIGTLIRELGGGMWISAEIFILTLLFSLPLGLVVAFGRSVEDSHRSDGFQNYTYQL